MRINTNINSLNAQGAATMTGKNLTSSLEKLSTGLKINKAADDASGMAIADKLKIQASSLGQSISNAGSASSLIQIADKAMGEQSNILDIVKTKLIQAKDATTSTDGRTAILNDIQKLLTQLDNIAAQTNYNGTTLLQASATDTSLAASLSFQVGESSTNTIASTAAASNTSVLGGGSNTVTTTGELYTMTSTADTAAGTTSYASKVVQLNSTTGAIKLSDTASVLTGESIHVNLAGTIGVISAESGDILHATITSSNTTDIAYLDVIASNNSNFSGSNGTYHLKTGSTVDLGTREWASVNVSSVMTSGTSHSTININNAGSSVTIKNLDTDTSTGSLGIQSKGAQGLIGGDLLSTLKDLTSSSFTTTIAGEYMSVVDDAVTQLNATRSDFGSTQNQLESAIRNMMTTKTNIKAAESTIRDVDYAAESANFDKQNIIAQAGTYALSQANAIQQNVLRLLQ